MEKSWKNHGTLLPESWTNLRKISEKSSQSLRKSFQFLLSHSSQNLPNIVQQSPKNIRQIFEKYSKNLRFFSSFTKSCININYPELKPSESYYCLRLRNDWRLYIRYVRIKVYLISKKVSSLVQFKTSNLNYFFEGY